MKKTPIQILCLLDRSGSMRPIISDVIGSFNQFIEDQRKEKGHAQLTLIIFDDKYEVIYDKKDIRDVAPLTKEIYFARGWTALYDAVGYGLTSLGDAKDVIVLIQTDGQENKSTEWKKESIKKLIEEKEALGWDFNFVGADIDASSEAGNIGIRSDKSYQMDKSGTGVTMAFACLNSVTSNYRKSKEEA